MSSRPLVSLVAGSVIGLAALGASGHFSVAAGMPPYPGEDVRYPLTPGAASVAKYDTLRRHFAERGICQPGGVAEGTQVQGTFNILAICVDFSDKVAQTAAIKFDTLIFGTGTGTVRDFYNEMSYGTLQLTTVHLPSSLGWQRNPQTYAYYVNNNFGLGNYPQNTQKLTEDLVDLIDPLVDFSQYDNDGDTYVDGLVICHAGRGAELSGQTSDIWSHKWGISPRLKDGVRIMSYSVQPEYWINPGDMTIGVYAHEIGHLFGLPDLYDVDGSSRGVGRWSLMSSGSWNGSLGSSPAHMDAWCKSQVGFVAPINVGSNMAGATLPQVEDSAKVYRLWASGQMGNEYFLVENRQRVGYDAGLPSAGLLIWHIDDNQTSNTKEWYPGHTATGHYWVALEQADTLWEMEKNIDQGDTGDPFPGSTNKTTFSAASTPNSDDYTGTPTYVTVTNISPSGAVMTCDFQVSLAADAGGDDVNLPSGFEIVLSNHPNPFNPSTVIAYSTGTDGPASLDIFDLLGRHVTTLSTGPVAAGAHEVVWDGRDADGHAVGSGVYFATLVSGGQSSVRKMVLVR